MGLPDFREAFLFSQFVIRNSFIFCLDAKETKDQGQPDSLPRVCPASAQAKAICGIWFFLVLLFLIFNS
jgi:hypothetical protein